VAGVRMSVIIDPNPYPVDDAALEPGKNGKPALAAQIQRIVTGLNRQSYSGRTLYTWWGGDDTTNSHNVLRTVYNHHHQVNSIACHLIGLDNDNTATTSQRASLEIDTVSSSATDIPWSPGTSSPASTEPADLTIAGMRCDDVTGLFAPSTLKCDMSMGSMTANGPIMTAGVIYEPAQTEIDPGTASTAAWVPQDFARPDGGIVATAPGTGLADLDRLRLMLLHTWNRKRPTFAWSIAKPGTNYVQFSTAPTAYRYIWDQTIGDTGTAPTITGPGLTVPLRYAGSGVNTTIKCALYVYAAMSDAIGTGYIAVSHKAAGGASMTAFDRGTNPISVTGTSFAWYATMASATPNFHALRTDLAYDRVVIGAKRGAGASGEVRIGAYALFPMHSTTIT